MSDSPDSLIEFPAELSVKAMGLNTDEFADLVTRIVTSHVPGENAVRITKVASSHAKYLSVRAHFTAENLEQLHAIYASLRADERGLYAL